MQNRGMEVLERKGRWIQGCAFRCSINIKEDPLSSYLVDSPWLSSSTRICLACRECPHPRTCSSWAVHMQWIIALGVYSTGHFRPVQTPLNSPQALSLFRLNQNFFPLHNEVSASCLPRELVFNKSTTCQTPLQGLLSEIGFQQNDIKKNRYQWGKIDKKTKNWFFERSKTLINTNKMH